jgi:hypothetical protein
VLNQLLDEKRVQKPGNTIYHVSAAAAPKNGIGGFVYQPRRPRLFEAALSAD